MDMFMKSSLGDYVIEGEKPFYKENSQFIRQVNSWLLNDYDKEINRNVFQLVEGYEYGGQPCVIMEWVNKNTSTIIKEYILELVGLDFLGLRDLEEGGNHPFKTIINQGYNVVFVSNDKEVK